MDNHSSNLEELIKKSFVVNETLKQENQMLRENNAEKVCHTNNNQTQGKSDSSENGTSSKSLFPTYKKRPGANDVGKEFEYMMCALYTLKLCTEKNIVDFEITTNNDKYGDFDDISLEVKYVNETKKFLLQLKHKENEQQYLTNQKLIAAKSEFSLSKYLKSFQELNARDVTCLVYTNSQSKLKDASNFSIFPPTQKNNEEQSEDTKIEVKVKKLREYKYLNLLRNNQDPKKFDEIFQFEMTQEETTLQKLESFCGNFFLLTGQDNVKTVNATVNKMLISLVGVDIYDSFVFFMKEWWAGRYVLTKRDIISKLVELAMSPWIQTVSWTKVNSKTQLLSDGIMNFEMTVLKNTNNIVISQTWASSRS